MKKLNFLFSALFSLITFCAMAQNGPGQPPPVEERVKRTIERITPELKLNEQQVKDVNPVYTVFYTEIDKLRAAGNPTPEDRQKLMATRDEKLKKILSEEQMKKLKELEEQMRQQRRQGGPPQIKN